MLTKYSDGTGDLGETILHGFVSRENINWHEPRKDKFGWDCFIEFEIKEQTLLPYDKLKPKIPSYIQVKTTRNRHTFPIKLTNWLHMIQEPNPFFILVVYIDENNYPKKVYLAHVGEKLMVKALRELRTYSGMELNKKCLSYIPSGEDLIIDHSKPFLRSTILKIIGDDIEKYREDKKRILQNSGYEEGSVQVKFDASLDLFIDHLLGLSPSVPVQSAKIAVDVRFGIPVEVENYVDGAISFDIVGRNVDLRFVCSKGLTATFSAKILTSDFVTFQFPQEKWAFRVISDNMLFEIIAKGGKHNGKFDFTKCFSEKTIMEWLQISKLVRLLSIDEKKWIEIDTKCGAHPIILQISNVSISHESILLLESVASTIENMNYLLSVFDQTLSTNIDFSEMDRQKNKLVEIRCILDSTINKKLMIEYSVNFRIDEGRHIVMPKVIWIQLLGLFYVIISEYHSIAESISDASEMNRYRGIITSMYADKRIVTNPSEIDLRMEVDKILNKYKNNQDILCIDMYPEIGT